MKIVGSSQVVDAWITHVCIVYTVREYGNKPDNYLNYMGVAFSCFTCTVVVFKLEYVPPTLLGE